MVILIDYNVQLIQFPNKKVKETIVKNEDDSYTIFIDASLSSEEQRNAIRNSEILNGICEKLNSPVTSDTEKDSIKQKLHRKSFSAPCW